MKIFQIIIAMVIGGINSMPAQQELFDESIQLLKNSQVSQAIALMDSIHNMGYISTELYSNLAHAHALNHDHAHAILNYERALVWAPHNKNIHKALAAHRKQLQIQISEIPDFILVTYYRSIVNMFTASTWSILQLILGIISIGALFLLWFSPPSFLSRRVVLITTIAACVMSILLACIAWSKKGYENSQHQGIIMMDDITLHQAPDKLSPTVAPLGAGNKVFILSEIGEWYKVTLRDKDTGWVKKEEVTII